jgi:nucleoside phosphorylase
LDEDVEAFYVTVQDLAAEGFFGSQRSEAQQRFENWKQSTEPAYFFLDAIDEARLNGQTLGRALTKLEQALGLNIERAHVMISCRVSDWRAHSDREAIQAILFPEGTTELSLETIDERSDEQVEAWNDDGSTEPPAAKNTMIPHQSAPRVEVFAIAPLDAQRVEALVRSLGVKDPKEFMSAAKEAAAFAFLERPRDVEWLVAYWLEHGEFGNLTELVENDVRQKLVERNPNHKRDLSPTRAKAAVEMLSGVCALERKASLQLPDEALDPERSAAALDPALILPDFSTNVLAELLTLPIFDEATYGRVRIHHRTVAEYLAAQWLLSLLRAGLATSELDAVLFRDGPEGPVVPKELRPVAAWIAGSNAVIRKRLLEVASTVLLEGGDPSSLPDGDRRELLLALAKQYSTRKRLFKNFDEATLKRLASPNIVATVRELLATSSNDEFLDTLLTLVGEGHLESCADDALRLAAASSTPLHARHEAIRALAKVGNAEQIETLLRLLIDVPTEINHEIAGTLLAAFYPRWMTTDRLIMLLSRAESPKLQTGTILPYFLGQKVYGETPLQDQLRLIRGIVQIITEEKDPPQELRQSWLLAPLAMLLHQFASGRSSDELEAIRPVLRLYAHLSVHEHLDHEQGEGEVRKLIESHTAARRMMFWEHVAVVRRERPSISRHLDLVPTDPDPLWSLSAEDLSWLSTDAIEHTNILDRLLAFDCLVAAPAARDDQRDIEALVRPLIDRDPTLAKRWRRYGARSHIETSKPMWKLKRQLIHARRKQGHDNDLKWLHEHLKSIRDGSEGNALTILAKVSHLAPQEPSKAIAKLTKDYDADVANAAREGWRNLWRKLPCLLPHEEPEPNRFLVSMLAGFAGITIDFEDGLDAAALSFADAITAARYASRAMNSFPSWLDALAQHQPTAVGQVFGECIAADYARPTTAQTTYNVMHLLSYASNVVRELCAPLLIAELTSKDPERLDTLEACIEALIATPSAHSTIAPLVASRCVASRSDYDRFALWWCALLAVSPTSAVVELQTVLDQEPGAADARVLSVCDRFWRIAEDRRLSFPFLSEATPLGQLVGIIFHHIRPDDDVQHTGMYSPGPRDHAESLQRYLLDRLANIPGDETYRALQQVANDPVLATSRDYLLALAEERASLDASERDPTVAERLVRASKEHGLAAVDHLEEWGLKTMRTATVDFGIITALNEERDAVLAALGSYTQLDKDGTDTHTYYEAAVQTARSDKAVYRVILVCCPNMGPEVAVSTAAALLNRWKPRHVLLVGIAMGVAGETKHGDVMVADQVVDYTLGKKEGGKKRETRWRAFLPGQSLFESSKAMPKTWANQIKVTRPGPGIPDILHGVIATGGDVIADDEVVAEIQKQWPKLIGIEMEAGGIATAVHDNIDKPDFLMIKAVSDYGKDKKDPAVIPWREYADAAAATFAVELMRSGPAAPVKR